MPDWMVGEPDGHLVADAEPEGAKAPGQGLGALAKIREGQPLVVEDERLAVGVPRGHAVEECADGGVVERIR